MFALAVTTESCTRLAGMLACRSFDSLAGALQSMPDFQGRVHLFGDTADFDKIEGWMVPRLMDMTSGPNVACRGRVPPGLHIMNVQCQDRTFYTKEFIPLGMFYFLEKVFLQNLKYLNRISTRFLDYYLGSFPYGWKFSEKTFYVVNDDSSYADFTGSSRYKINYHQWFVNKVF
jgi:hypothetical protein